MELKETLVFFALSLLYTFGRHLMPTLYIGAFVKIIPIFYLIHAIDNGLFPKEKSAKKYIGHIRLALLFSLFGDIMLVYIHDNDKFPLGYLFWGTVLFAAGHMNYLVAFGMKPLTKNNYLKPVLVIVCIVTLSTYINMSKLRELGQIYVFTVPIYSAILLTMTWRSVASNSHLGLKKAILSWRGLGGIIFLVSDMLLSLTELTGIIPASERMSTFLVLSTYYLSQYCFAKSAHTYRPEPPKFTKSKSKRSK